MDKNEFHKILENIDIYDKDKLDEMAETLKFNFCQNMRIARKLSNISPDIAAQILNLEPQSLRRIEAEKDRNRISSRVILMAIMLYEPDADFYFKNWETNEKMLEDKKLLND